MAPGAALPVSYTHLDVYKRQPETFIEPLGEAIGDAAPLVLWYVAQLANDDTPGTEYCWAESVVCLLYTSRCV